MVDCPSTQLLEQLLQEELNDPELTIVLTHVEDCSTCQRVLHHLALSTPGPTPLGLLSALAEPALSQPRAEAEAFFDRFKTMPRKESDPKPEVEGYEILEEIGRGAAGIVYRARHRDLDRLVALKMILAGPHLSSEARLRFRREAQALARLQHPNIVQVYDVGEQAGYPYLALELVEGSTLARWLGGSPRSAREAAQVTATLARAVEYAHHQGVIHRDLKPANILLRMEGAANDSPDHSASRAVPGAILKIADFGLAKLLSTSSIVEDPISQSGAIVGTPVYVAPEQARGEVAEVGPTADVYSIGVILYELLTGRPPFQGPTPIETLVQAAHQEPVPPARLVHKVPRDLQTICLKCLEKSPGKRYPTAAELAADLERFLNYEPIRARPVGWFERCLRWMRRNKGVSAALAGVALLLVLLAAGSLIAAAHFRTLEQEQRALAREKGRLVDEKEAERKKAVDAENRAVALREVAEKQQEELRRNLYFARMNLVGQAAASPGGIGRIGELLAPWQPAVWEQRRTDLRQWEWYYLYGLCHRDQRTLSGHEGAVLDVAWSPGGQWLASAGADGTVRLWDVADGAEFRSLRGHSRAVTSVAWSQDGKRLASASGDGTVKLWNANTGEETFVFRGHTGVVLSVAWSPDGNRLASSGLDQTIQIWHAATGAKSLLLHGHSDAVSSVSWSPDGQRLASAGQDSTARLWDTRSGEETRVLRGHINWVNKIAWSPDGSRLASASNDDTAKLWDPASGEELLTLRGHTEGVLSVAWSPDGSHLVTSSDDQSMKVWSATGGREIFSLRGHTDKAGSVAWSPTGKQLASAGYDTTIKIWDAATGPETVALRGHEGAVDAVTWSSDNQHLASAGTDKTVQVWDMTHGMQPLILSGHTQRVRCVTWDPDKTHLASAGSDGTIRVWDAHAGKQLNVLSGHAGEVFSVAWSPGGRMLASGGSDQTVRIWDADSGEQVQCFRGHQQWVRCVAWSPDGTRVASASWDRTIKVWDVATGRETLSLAGHTHEVTSVMWSPDGQRLASASNDQTVRIWDAATGDLILTLRGHTARVNEVAWSPDGMRLASAGWDQTVKVWDSSTGKETLNIAGHQSRVNAVAWSPDGLVLVSAGSDQTILVHDATAGYLTARATEFLPVLDRCLAADPNNRADWRLRAEIHAQQGDWDDAAADVRQSFELDREKRWFTLGPWVAGPYPEHSEASHPIEENFEDGRSAGEIVPAGPPAVQYWRSIPLNASGFVNLGAQFGHGEHISAYVLLRVYSPKNQPVAILLGSDDYVRLWLDSKLIHENMQQRGAKPDEDAVPATLNAGWNTLTARVVNVTGDHSLYFRLSDAPADLERARVNAAH